MNVAALSSAAPPSEAVGDPLTDTEHWSFVALHPLYSSTDPVRKRVLAFRIAVCVCAFLSLLLSVVGQLVPFSARGAPYSTTTQFSFWREMEYTHGVGQTVNKPNTKGVKGGQATSLLTVFFSFFAFILSIVFVVRWCRYERLRREEERANARLRSKYGEESNAMRSGDAVPRGRPQIVEDCVDVVTFEDAERERRQLDRNLGIALFAMMLAAAVAAAVTVALMGVFYFYNIEGAEMERMTSGFSLFVVTLIFAVVGFVILSVPAASALYLCGVPRVPGIDWRILSTSLPESQIRRERNAQQEQRKREDSYYNPISTTGYKTGAYFEAPPQLFNVREEEHQGEAAVSLPADCGKHFK